MVVLGVAGPSCISYVYTERLSLCRAKSRRCPPIDRQRSTTARCQWRLRAEILSRSVPQLGS